MWINDSIALTMLYTNFIDDYIGYDSDAGVFMSILLFPLTYGFGATSYIVNFKICLYASIFLNHCYVGYYQWYNEYDLNVFITLRGQM